MWYRGGFTPVAIPMVAMTFMAAFYAPVSCEPVNVALNKNVEAQYTCGFYGAEQYYDHKDVKVSPQQRSKLTCATVNMHPPSALVDGSTTTKWQSTSRLNIYTQTNLNPAGTGDLEAILKIDLQQDFLVEKIIIKLEDSLRPDRIAVSKSNDGNQFIPWAYKVTEQDDCSGKFSSSFKPLPTSSGDTVCATYPKPLPQTFETIEFDFSSVAPELREWRRVKYLEIRFYKMPLVFAVAGTAFQHYSISELEVLAECSCNGQQIGCKQDNTTKEYVCECGGNTKGQFCEMCMSFFNQKPFVYGVPCESCNCMNHATECSYDKDIDAGKQSINSTGQKSGGGKCLDCQDYTAGINCENCSPFFFRPLNKSQTDKDACVACGCSSLGSDANPVSGLVADCIMNNERLLNSGQNPGDCFCKKNVIGSKCDTCKEGFFNLRVDNNEGCEECGCFTSGTVGGSTVCEADSIGQCPCKANVGNRKCDVCKDGFYNLVAVNLAGCTPCGCDVGGSLSMICDKTFGKCSCRPNINATKCDMPNTGFYYPDVHFISAEFESGTGDASLSQEPQYAGYKGYGYADLKSGNVVGVNMVIPGGTQLSSKFIFVIRYRSTQAASGLLKIKGSDIPETTVSFPVCSTGWCYVNTLSIRSNYTLPLTATITIRVLQPILLDQIVAVPVEFNSPDASLVDSSFGNVCNVLENSLGEGNVEVEKLCKKSIYSMTTYYLNGALPCKCDPEGSFSTDCSQYGGLCSCKVGVGGRKCDECLPGFYDHSITGCKPCDCKGTNKFCNKGTGQCVCPPNTIGRTCDQCAIYHWNWNSTVGCQPCGCDTTGSIQLGCNSATGICTCKIGVQGEKCNECIDNYKGFSSSGCSSCLCSTVGSNGTVCNKTSGQCSCKSNVAGLSCDKCSDTSFYLNGNNEQGCLDCICMGITKTCSSSSQRVIVISTLLTTNSGTGGQLKSSRKLSNNQGIINENIAINVITSDTTPYLSVTFNVSSSEYWMAPDDLKGNLLTLYGTTIDIEILYTGSGVAMPPQAIMVGQKGRYIHNFGTSITADTRHSLSIPLSEKYWVKEGTSTVLSRSDFILAISEVKYILLPASFLGGTHTSK
ncbi:laminin subunit alpha-3 [Patella vulgata]|uniref:laminin subunit alpha-3 n=1 Tax=Patella vulgata TaxID=6465 RepID=UPI00217FBB11|nr:laminin subunit alpha-3 [Patella vulgata]